MISKLGEFLKDNAGEFSSLRLIIILIIFVFMGMWSYICIKTSQFVPLSMADVVLLLGLLGAKVSQSVVENKK